MIVRALRTFLERLRGFTVLDPACGSGNFLYLAPHALKDIEHRVQLEAETLGLARGLPAVGPANVKGIEINAYAVELARVSVWIGEIQWLNGRRRPSPKTPGLRHHRIGDQQVTARIPISRRRATAPEAYPGTGRGTAIVHWTKMYKRGTESVWRT